ncbi:MAG: holo-ACP synthase [Anaerolineae bacterium]|nr:holo-ACP synthase [Anaerolineae bacterium]
MTDDNREILEQNLGEQLQDVAAALPDLHLVGVGIDLTDIAWAARIIEKYPKQLSRIFHQEALDYCLSKKDPAPYLAARMAAKEAVVKALGTGLAPGMRWLDIQLVRTLTGKPDLLLHGKVRERAEALGVVRWELSIAHRGAYATAIAAAVGAPVEARRLTSADLFLRPSGEKDF